MNQPFRTFVIRKNGGGPRYEVVAWTGKDKERNVIGDVMLSPVGKGKDFIISKQEFRDNYIKAD